MTPIPKTASLQKRSQRNSVQNGPIERSTALTGTIFVTISVFMSRGPKVDPDPKKSRHHKNVRTEILCRMVRSRGPQLPRGLFSLPFQFFCFRTQKLTPIPKIGVVTKTFAQKFCAEWSDREVHSSRGDYFRDSCCFHASGQFLPPLAEPREPNRVNRRTA